MASSAQRMTARRRGSSVRLLTGTEAKEIADRPRRRRHAHRLAPRRRPGRRAEVRSLLSTRRPGPRRSSSCALSKAPARRLRPRPSLDHARSPRTARAADALGDVPCRQRPVLGRLLDFQLPEVIRAVEGAARAAQRPEITMRVYMDTDAADAAPRRRGHRPQKRSRRTCTLPYPADEGVRRPQVRNHAKFLSIDHRFLLVTSANFSWSAENANVEFGVLIDNPNLAEASRTRATRSRRLGF